MSQAVLSELNTANQKTFDFLHEEFKGLQLGRASAGLIEGISIESYGSSQPLKNLATIGVDGPQSLTISPWDKGLLQVIEKVIRENQALGLSPLNDGVMIRLNIPTLTKERRQELAKHVSKLGEEAKVGIRKHRHAALDNLKKEELSEDELKGAEKEVQTSVDNANKKIDDLVKVKQADILKI